MAKIPVGVQLYSVRQDFDQDPKGTLEAISKMGYEGVEFAGNFKHDVKQLAAWLNEFGLKCCGWHIPFDLVQDDKLEESIEVCKTLGCGYAIIPWLNAGTIAEWEERAAFFNTLADKLAKHGIVTGYHNHAHEFVAIDGKLPWDVFFGNTKREVSMQLDVGNAASGGADVVSVLKAWPGRAQTVHLKPYSKVGGYEPLIGEDDQPWAEISKLCEETQGTKWYIVEYECDGIAALEAVDRCLKAWKAMA